ncbi:hypothetical protein R3P38DRAFT_2788483 [Favolaschia claudopus]|uniref:Uncharacterized protein n=1 Tax=Favolaschia claudopus TaxID=2862362 RepID=A0AAW0AM05_9AGAR
MTAFPKLFESQPLPNGPANRKRIQLSLCHVGNNRRKASHVISLRLCRPTVELLELNSKPMNAALHYAQVFHSEHLLSVGITAIVRWLCFLTAARLRAASQCYCSVRMLASKLESEKSDFYVPAEGRFTLRIIDFREPSASTEDCSTPRVSFKPLQIMTGPTLLNVDFWDDHFGLSSTV